MDDFDKRAAKRDKEAYEAREAREAKAIDKVVHCTACPHWRPNASRGERICLSDEPCPRVDGDHLPMLCWRVWFSDGHAIQVDATNATAAALEAKRAAGRTRVTEIECVGHRRADWEADGETKAVAELRKAFDELRANFDALNERKRIMQVKTNDDGSLVLLLTLREKKALKCARSVLEQAAFHWRGTGSDGERRALLGASSIRDLLHAIYGNDKKEGSANEHVNLTE
jgi:hypothetical protein